MIHQLTTEDEEYERLGTQVVNLEYKNRKRELFAKQVSDFAILLEPKVRQGLKQEACSDIAKEWVGEARRVLAKIVREPPPKWEQTKGFKRAEDLVQRELTEHFFQKALEPSEKEILTQARELAQCVLANWFSILEHTKHGHAAEPLRLNANAIPQAATLGDLFLGVEAYVVPIDILIKYFHQYLKLLCKTKSVVELAPNLFLVYTAKNMYITISAKKGKDLVTNSQDKHRVSTRSPLNHPPILPKLIARRFAMTLRGRGECHKYSTQIVKQTSTHTEVTTLPSKKNLHSLKALHKN